MAQIKLGELLVKAGHLSADALARALDEQRKWGGRIGRVLREMNFVTEEILIKALSKQLGLPRADLTEPTIPSPILAKIDPSFAIQNRLCPERYDDSSRTLLIAMEDHLNLPALDQIAQRTGTRVRASLATNAEISAGLARLYPSHPATMTAKSAKTNMAIFETQDFSQSAAEARGADPGPPAPSPSSVKLFDTADFSEAARKLQAEETAKKKETVRVFGTDDFSDAAKKVRDDDD
jgi:hypothetical protein